MTDSLPPEAVVEALEERLAEEHLTENPQSAQVGGLLRYTLPSLALAGGLSLLEILRSRFQHSQTFLPTRYPTGVWDPRPYGLEVENVELASEDGVALHGWWIAHPKPVATVVYCHGNSGSIADRVGIFRELRRLKVNIFAFDYRGYGKSAGEPSEKGLFLDVRAACDWVHEVAATEWSRILLFGHSLGGAVAIDGALHRPVAGLVVQSSFTNTRDMARHFFPGLPVHLIARNMFRSIDKVAQLELPKLFIHGTEDGTVPFTMGQRLYHAASEPKSWYEVRRAGHNDVGHHGGFRYLRTLSRFRDHCVRVAQAG